MARTTAPPIVDRSGVSPAVLEGLADRVATTGSRDAIEVTAPATDEPIGRVPACTAADVEAAVERATAAQSAGAELAPEDRAEIVSRFGDLILAHREELLDLLQLETGKSRGDAIEEVLDVANTCQYYAEKGPSFVADEKRSGMIPGATTARVTYDPIGVVGIISPWNYPMTLAVTDAIPALVAGNAVVLKPDSQTPYVALKLAELLSEAGLPDGLFEIVTGSGSEIGTPMIEAVDYVAFTGSTATGRLVAEQAGLNLIDCSLELGGKNPLLVLADADVEEAARGAVEACFSNAGQLCISAERIYVHHSRYDEFVDEFVGATRALTLGTGFDYEADVGSLIGRGQLETVREHVDDAVDRGATVLTGGRERPDLGPYFYEPTILTDVDPAAKAACEETFGPVVSVEPVPDVDRAIEAANDSPYGLNASVWTGDRERGVQVAREIDCGTVCVNDAYIAGFGAADAPMGGMGDSGLGRRHGPEGIERYLEARTIAVSRIGPIAPPPGVPTKWFARGLTALTSVQRYLPGWAK